MDPENLEFKANEDWAKHARQNPWSAFVPEEAIGSDGVEYIKVRGREVIYRVVSEDSSGHQKYECASCDSDVKGTTVAHPIRDGPSPLSGPGRVRYEQVPYCPNCEEEPSFHGSPIVVD